jgi:DNA polymerase-3 subunit beta
VRTQTLNLKCARYEANLKGIDAQEFPLIPALEEGDSQITLEAAAFRRMSEQVVLAAATDESRPILTGVLAKFEGNKLTLAAADGFRLSVRTAELPAETEPASVIIPARALAELARISTDEEDITLVITPTRKQVLFHAPNVDLVSQLIEGNFPDYQQIIPKSSSTRTVLNTNSFLRACKTANIFARDAANIARIQVAPGDELMPGHITIAATSAELGDNVGEMDASIEGNAVEIAFNVKYLIDVLSVMDSAQVVLETTTSSSPGVLKPVGDVDFVHVIMPMHVRSD